MNLDFNDPSIRELFTNPSKWTKAFLRNPNDSSLPFIPKSYQDDIFQNTRNERRMVLRWGRRLGKSVSLCADTLWWASTYPLVKMLEDGATKQQKIEVLIATPYETQIKMLWNMYLSLIGDSPLLKDWLVKVRTSDVHSLEFSNGSCIKGYTIGISSSNKGTSLRGLDANVLFIDEMDAIPREIIDEVLMPIWTGHPDCILRVSSTPTGKRELFYDICTNEELGWWHRHHPSWHPDNDRWISIDKAKEMGMPITESTEFQVKTTTPSEIYAREYAAEFGESFGGIYKHHIINRNLAKYGRNIDLTDADVFDPGFQQKPEHKYIMGVDWNSYVNGGQIVIVELCTTPTIVKYYDDDKDTDVSIDFTGKYRLFYRIGVKAKDATQRKTREQIIRLLRYYKIDFLYVDYGAGDTNIEELSFYGKKYPELDLKKKLRVIDSGAVVDHWDHITQKKVKKRNKSLMINFSVLSLEEDRILLPKEEDNGTRLIGQMRGYKVKNITSRGDYSYEGEDHILDAFNLAMYGFEQNYGHLLNSFIRTSIRSMPEPRMADYPLREQEINEHPSHTTRFDNIVDPERKEYYINKHKPKRIQVPFGHSGRGRSLNLGRGGRSNF